MGVFILVPRILGNIQVSMDDSPKLASFQALMFLHEPQPKLFKGDYIEGYIGDHYRGY